jgi:chromosome segregation ATPase
MASQALWLVGAVPRSLGRAVAGTTHAVESINSIERHVSDLHFVADDVEANIQSLRETAERQDRRVAEIQADLKQFDEELARIRGLVENLAEAVESATERLPDKDATPLGKVRQAVTGGDHK